MQDPYEQVEEHQPESRIWNVGEGDFRGPYGYGRPAHRPDPEARYEFRIVQRQLPVKTRLRWSVSG